MTVDDLDRRVTSTTQRCNTVEGKYKAALQEKTETSARLLEAEKELDDLRKQLEKLQKKVEEATVERVDHNNRIMSLNEELTFNKKKNAMVSDCTHSLHPLEIHKLARSSLQELDALRRADTRVAFEKSQVVTDIADQIDGQLDDHIKELKEQSRVECELMKRELERTYQETVRTLIILHPFSVSSC